MRATFVPPPAQALSAKDIRAKGMALVDGSGRQVIFSGINLIHKGNRLTDGQWNFIPDWPEDIYLQFRSLGLNLVRLGIIWAALEPRPGQYDTSYLDFINHQLDLAAAAGISVVLDMHQDLYAQRFSDGAPDWAVLSDHPFEATELWSDAYLFSPAVQSALDAFWANQQVPESGKGLQDHFASLWAMLAQRFKGHPALLGYDILNEPAPGSGIQAMFMGILHGFAAIMSQEEAQALGISGEDGEELLSIFLDPEKKLAALALLEDRDKYLQLGDLAAPLVMEFEQNTLAPFYTRVCQAIREQDQLSFLLRGNNYLSNLGVPPGLPAITCFGKADSRQIFTPHGYDLTVDTPAIEMASDQRAYTIFLRHRQTQQSLNLPVIVGEWGAFGASGAALRHGQSLLDQFESYHWGSSYWCYEQNFLNLPAGQLLKRPRALMVAGSLETAGFDPADRVFRASWDEAGCHPGNSLFFLPDPPKSIHVDGRALPQLQAGWLSVPVTGQTRSLIIAF